MQKRLDRAARLTAIAVVFCASTALAGVNRWTTHWAHDVQVTSLAIDPTNSDIVYAGTASGVLKTGNGGLSWNDPSNGSLDVSVHCVAIDPETASVHLGTTTGIFASTDGGTKWSNRLAARGIYNIVFGSEHTAYAADYDVSYDYPGPSILYRSSNQGNTWNSTSAPFSINRGTLVVHPTQPETLYAATSDNAWGGDGFIFWKSVDGGLTWPHIIMSGLTLAVDPQNPATLYCGGHGGVWKSVDAGSTWHLVSSYLWLVTTLAVDPRNSSTVYAGTDAGVFRSSDGGRTWADFNNGLGGSFISALAIDRTGSKLHVASGGIFDYQISSGALDVSVGSDNKAHLLFTDSESQAVFWAIDGSGNSGSAGPYGPYGGWSPMAVADGFDGLTRVLWSHRDGSAALWLYGASGNQASFRLGPVPGWTAVDVAAGTPGTTHILWTHVDGRVGFWAVDNSGHVSYGPKLTPDQDWNAVAIADGADGLTRLLWNKADGSAGLSLVGMGGLLATYRCSASPGWRAVDVAVGADGQSRILWKHADGRMALWRVDDSGNVTARGPVYDAPAGFTAQRVGAGPDGSTRVLWSGPSGLALLWQMSAGNVYQQSFTVGPN